MKIADIYKKYTIMPSLQLHMYRVAGVGQLISETSKVELNKKDIITVCLLHDMGNIIKFNLDLFPEFFKPEGVEYWKGVQKDYFSRYGSNEHKATLQIAHELQVSKRIIELINSVGFSTAKANYVDKDMEKKIAMYSDMRVEPYGVVSLESRLSDGKERFNLNRSGEERVEFFDEMAENLKKIEEQIFNQSSIRAEDITEQIVWDRIEELKNFEI